MPPRLTHPVSRDLVVADIGRSLRFYRDQLGFEVSDAAATYGPALIEFRIGDDTIRPAMVLFETDDLDALFAELTSRGTNPGSIEKVNWIKIRFFEVRDPDGHRIWFGQSYQQPDQPYYPAGFPQLNYSLPYLPFTDVAAGVAHYRDVLGFKINYAQDDLGVMDRDKITVLLVARTTEFSGIGACGFYVKDVDALYSEYTGRGAKTLGAPVSYPWGLRSFTVVDPEGNKLTFSQTFE